MLKWEWECEWEEKEKMIVRVPSRPHESDYPWFRVFAPYNSESSSEQCWTLQYVRLNVRMELNKNTEEKKKLRAHLPPSSSQQNHIHRGDGRKNEHHRRFHDSQTHDFHSQFHNFLQFFFSVVLCFCFTHYSLPICCPWCREMYDEFSLCYAST